MAANPVTRMVEAAGNDRKLRAYAYLQASFETRPRHGDYVTDLLDCFTPFLVDAIAQQRNNQIDLGQIQKHLKEQFSFDLNVFYDTSLLLRLLGTSGTTLRVATAEMHAALESLGCHIWFFDHTEQEVQNVLESIVGAHDYGNSAVFLNTARRIAQDISLSSGLILKKLNTMELFERARRAAQEQKTLEDEDFEKRAHQIDEEAVRRTEERLAQEHEERLRNRAQIIAQFVKRICEFGVIGLFALSLAAQIGVFGEIPNGWLLAWQIISGVLGLLSFFEMMRFSVVHGPLGRLQHVIEGRLVRLLRRLS